MTLFPQKKKIEKQRTTNHCHALSWVFFIIMHSWYLKSVVWCSTDFSQHGLPITSRPVLVMYCCYCYWTSLWILYTAVLLNQPPAWQTTHLPAQLSLQNSWWSSSVFSSFSGHVIRDRPAARGQNTQAVSAWIAPIGRAVWLHLQYKSLMGWGRMMMKPLEDKKQPPDNDLCFFLLLHFKQPQWSSLFQGTKKMAKPG